MRDLRAIFPAIGSEYRGTAVSFWFLVVMAVLTTARGLAQIFLPDGGTEVIGNMHFSPTPLREIMIGIFGQWGLAQLLIAVVVWVVILRYRFLVPFALFLLLLGLVGSFGVSQSKPVELLIGPALWEIQNYVFVPLVAIALWFSLPRRGVERGLMGLCGGFLGFRVGRWVS